MDRSPWYETSGGRIVHRAFLIAAETGELCRPVHLLAALAELDGPISDALRPPHGGPLLSRPTNPAPLQGGGASYLVMQTQQAANQLASRRNETAGPEHLFLAVLDQAESEAAALLTRAGLDPTAVRRAAVDILGASPDLPRIFMPPLTPAGTLDRPPLPVGELDPSAWATLCWRQDHLPLGRVRRRAHYAALHQLEARASRRMASELALDDDQRYSLSRHHLDRVEELVALAKPDLVERRSSRPRDPIAIPIPAVRRRFRRPRWMNFTVGWGTWFANRGVGLRDRWFRLRTMTDYRGAPSRSGDLYLPRGGD
ncbi:MAG: Clp protease N-terminal domain-containing protein [Mycobacteriales bacterium]